MGIINGMTRAASALRYWERRQEVVANNLANADTNGFRAQRTFASALGDAVPVAQTAMDARAGSLKQTGNPLDVALSGPGFLTVQTPNGNRYTRDGALAINASGTLVDLDGNPVLSSNGPVTFAPDETDITISKDGTISSSQGIKGQLSVAEFADPQQMTRAGNNLWDGPNPQPNVNTTVIQGSVEQSNVSGVTEMATMMKVQRAYEQMADLMSRQDDLRNEAVQKLGSLSA